MWWRVKAHLPRAVLGDTRSPGCSRLDWYCSDVNPFSWLDLLGAERNEKGQALYVLYVIIAILVIIVLLRILGIV